MNSALSGLLVRPHKNAHLLLVGFAGPSTHMPDLISVLHMPLMHC